jgi:hypothetical protein
VANGKGGGTSTGEGGETCINTIIMINRSAVF